VLLIVVSASLVYGDDEDAIGEGLFIDGEGYIGPYLENTGDLGDYTGNLSSNNTSISENITGIGESTMNNDENATNDGENTTSDGENGTNIGEGLFIDDEGYIGPYLASLGNNSSNNLSNMSSNTEEAQEIMFSPEIDRDDLIRDMGFNEGFFTDLQGFMDHFGGFQLDGFDGRRLQPNSSAISFLSS
jgi:hypothetical protein